MLEDEQVVTILRQEIAGAQGANDDRITKNRKQALDYFFGEPRGDEIAGNSQVQSLDVADMTEAVLAEMMPAFSKDTLVVFEPDNDEDIRQAQMESDIVNNQIMERNQGYWLLSESIKDALLLRNSLAKVEIEETEDISFRILDRVDDVTLALALIPDEPNEVKRIESVKEVEDDFGRKSNEARISIKTISRRLVVRSVDPTRFIIQSNWDSIFIGDVRFCAEVDYPTRSDLREEGFSQAVVDELPAYTTETKTDVLARRRDTDKVLRQGSQMDKSMEVLERFKCYIRLDRDEDGLAERHEIQIVGHHLLADEFVDWWPFATGAIFVNPHQYTGISLFDRLKNIQDMKTRGIRQWLDNLDSNNHPTIILNPNVASLDDATDARSGKVIQTSDINAVREIYPGDIGSSSNMLLDYADKMRSERGGAALDLQGAELQLAGDTAHGIERQFTSREKLAAIMARNISESFIRQVYLLVHQTMRLKMPGEITTRLSGEFVTADPGDWPARDRVNVKTGLSTGERSAMKMTMAQVMETQGQLLGGGMDGVLADLQTYHNALTDWARASDIDNPQRYWIDPASEAAQQAAQGKRDQAQAASDREQQLNEMIFGVENQLEQSKIQLQGMADQMDKQAKDNDLRFKYFEAQLEAEVEEAKIIGGATLELQKQQEQGRLHAVDTSES